MKYYTPTYNNNNQNALRPHYTNRLTHFEMENQRNAREASSYNNYQPYTRTSNVIDPVGYARYQDIVTTRQHPVNTRIIRLFMEIDRLGNYTQSTWFSELTHLQYARLYRSLYDIWNYRGQLTMAIKIQICPFHGPFDGIFPNTVRHIDLSIDNLRMACLIVLENMIYSGINDELRQLGVMHALTALTVASVSARAALPWLYESIEG